MNASTDQNRNSERTGGGKAVVLLGLARSGTSTVTGVLHLLGVDMGAREYEDKWNPMGSFEDKDFQRVHKEIFDLAGEGRNYWNPPSYETLMRLKGKLTPRIASLVAEKKHGKALWGWKHTRTILTVDLFLEHLNDPHFVVVYRNPLATARSSVRHTQRYENPVDFHRALNLVNFYHGELIRFYERHAELPKAFVAYEQLIHEPKKEAAKIADFLGISPTESDLEEIASFVLPGDRLEQEKARSRSFLGGTLPRFLRKHGLR